MDPLYTVVSKVAMIHTARRKSGNVLDKERGQSENSPEQDIPGRGWATPISVMLWLPDPHGLIIG
jgi:hypothetical protein